MIIKLALGGYRPIGDSLPRKTWRTGAGISEDYAARLARGRTYPLAGVQGGPCEPTAPAPERALAGQAVP
jgi:hypothetical protein